MNNTKSSIIHQSSWWVCCCHLARQNARKFTQTTKQRCLEKRVLIADYNKQNQSQEARTGVGVCFVLCIYYVTQPQSAPMTKGVTTAIIPKNGVHEKAFNMTGKNYNR